MLSQLWAQKMRLILTCLTQVHFNMGTLLQNMQTIIIVTHKLQMVLLSSKEEQINIQTAPGYGTSNSYYQNSTWNGGSFENNYAQSYQNYPSSNTNTVQHSISVPTNSFSYQQQYNQWPYYYNHTVPNPAGDPVGNSNSIVNTTSSYSYPSIQPPPPGTTSWKSNSSSSIAPPIQASGGPGPQDQYINQAHAPVLENQYAGQVAGNPRSQNHYASQTPACPQSTVNLNPVQQSNHGDQQNTVFIATENSSENKMQVPRIAPGFSMVIPKSEKKILGADLSKKPAYVSVSMVKNDAVIFCSSFLHFWHMMF